MSSPSATARILVVAESDAQARTATASLEQRYAGDLASSASSKRWSADLETVKPEAIVVAMPALDQARRWTETFLPRQEGRRPFLLVLCDAAQTAEAARLCEAGVFDDYVQAYPVAVDADRLSTSVRLGLRGAPSPVAPADGDPAQAALPLRRKVLLVEDDEVLHQLVAAMLESEPVDVSFETDGARAIERIRTLRPDIVLMDINLPGLEGVEIVQRLKADAELAAIPVVMVTGEASRQTLLRSLGAGAADFLVKPLTREALLGKLWRFLPPAK